MGARRERRYVEAYPGDSLTKFEVICQPAGTSPRIGSKTMRAFLRRSKRYFTAVRVAGGRWMAFPINAEFCDRGGPATR